MILFINIHIVQQTSSLKNQLYKNKIVSTSIHWGVSSSVLPIDLVINKFFGYCWILSIAQRRTLKTSGRKQPGITKHFFYKCGLSSNLDGSKDDQIIIASIINYKMRVLDEEFISNNEDCTDDTSSNWSQGNFIDSNERNCYRYNYF